MSNNFKLSDFLKLANADGAIILNAKGELLEAENIDRAENFAAMSGVMLKMAKEFSNEIKIGGLKQFVFKAEKGVFVLNNFANEYIVGVYSKDIGKAGLIMMSMDKLSKSKDV